MVAADSQQGLAHYVAILRKRWRIALASVLIVPIVAYVYSILQPPLYQASSEVLLSRQNIAANLTGLDDPSGFQLSDRPLQTQADLARVPDVIRRTLIAAKRTDLSIGEFSALSSVGPRSNSDLLAFNVSNTEPWEAAKLATAYATQYTRYRLELDTAPARRARAQLQQRIRQLRNAGETDSRLYANLLDNEQRLATFEALQTSNAYVVRTADSAVQIQPQTRRDLMLGVGFGILLAFALAAVAHALDTRSQTVRDLEERLGVPLLARIPAPPSRNGTLVMRSDPGGVHAEAYRVLRANLEFVNRSGNARLVMVTSAAEGEGKSTTIANLAYAYAREGKHVVVVDLDLRRPTIARLFGIHDRPGVVEAAFGRARPETSLHAVPTDARHGSLRVMPASLASRNVGEFSASQELRELLRMLATDADLVLVDAPPLLVSSDAIALGAVVDGIVLVTGQGNLRWDALEDVIRALSMCQAPTLGWILTGAETMAGYSAYTDAANGRD